MADAKVLIVDDVESNLYVAKKLMASYGMTVETAASGFEAVARFRSGSVYDMVFMDHMMPEMDGIEAAQKIRELGVNTPIIALTAGEAECSGEIFFSAGMNALLTKPINKAALEKIFADWIPAEKFDGRPGGTIAEAAVGANTGLLKRIEKIEGLSVQTGLDRVGQWDIYEKLLKLTVREFANRVRNLNDFLAKGDLHSFCIEVHGLKSALANIGAEDLSAQARNMEDASGREDAAFCISNLPRFLQGLGSLNSCLTEAFARESQNSGPLTIPPELPPVFEKLRDAFGKNDFSAIDEGMESLNALKAGGVLKEEIDKINEAVLMIDYKGAMEVMQRLLG